ncbi:hypothetical protein EZS27_039583, partial [termite gut metagenome]
MGENLNKTVMKHIVRRIFVPDIAITNRQHLVGIECIKFLPSRIVSCPTAFNQFRLISQFEYFLSKLLFYVIYIIDVTRRKRLQRKMLNKLKRLTSFEAHIKPFYRVSK